MLHNYQYKIGGHNIFGEYISMTYIYFNLNSEAEGYIKTYQAFTSLGFEMVYCQAQDLNWGM